MLLRLCIALCSYIRFCDSRPIRIFYSVSISSNFDSVWYYLVNTLPLLSPLISHYIRNVHRTSTGLDPMRLPSCNSFAPFGCKIFTSECSTLSLPRPTVLSSFQVFPGAILQKKLPSQGPVRHISLGAPTVYLHGYNVFQARPVPWTSLENSKTGPDGLTSLRKLACCTPHIPFFHNTWWKPYNRHPFSIFLHILPFPLDPRLGSLTWVEVCNKV